MATIQETLHIGIAHHNSGRFPEAEAAYRAILDAAPQHPDARHLLGLLAYQNGYYPQAVALISEAIGHRGDNPVYHQHLALALGAMGRRDEALASARAALALNPSEGEVFNNLGNLLQDMGFMDDALDCRNKALERDPGNHLYRYNMGHTLERFGRVDEAEAMYRAALEVNSNFPEGWNVLGELRRKAGRLEEATGFYQKALALKADFPDALNNLGLAYYGQGKSHEAIAVFRRCLAISPSNDAALTNLGNVYQAQGQLEEAVELFRRAVQVNPDQSVAHSNLIFAMTCAQASTGASLLAEANEWDRQRTRRMIADIRPFALSPDPDRPLRIGFVSADFKDHAVSYFLLPLLRAFDRSSFQVVCYNETRNPDVVTGWFRDLADEWRDTLGIHDSGLAEMIRADKIDILVDCGGHSGGGRLPAFKLRPAPLQISTPLGHGGTTGVAEMDYFITDRHLTPEGCDDQFSERLIRLDRVFASFEPKDFWPEPAASPPDEPLFGCFGDPSRISMETATLWRRLLDAVPGSRILFKHKAFDNPLMREHWLRLLAPVADRAILEGIPGGWSKNMDVYGRVAAMLDTFPASGATSNLIPLWMGTPVLSRVGVHALQRFGAPILRNLGLDDLAAESDDAFVAAGVALMADKARLARLRRELRSTMKASALCDVAGITREWEAALREAWRRLVEGYRA